MERLTAKLETNEPRTASYLVPALLLQTGIRSFNLPYRNPQSELHEEQPVERVVVSFMANVFPFLS